MHRWMWIACTLVGCLALAALAGQAPQVTIPIGPHEMQVTPLGEAAAVKGNFSEVAALADGSNTNSITNGYNARPGQYPYVVVIFIYYFGYYYRVCGGVIINSHSVLTAAHCLRYIKYYRYYVGVGILNLRLGAATPGSQVIKVTSYVIHPGYNPYDAGYPNNLAVLHLYCRIKYTVRAKPARLAVKHDGRFSRNYCYIVGWGYTDWGYPTILQAAAIYSINNYQCRLFWAINPRARILDSHICMYRYPVSSCYGDAGGPLICHGIVAGIMSWNSLRCNGCHPGVCSRVSSYTRWIRSASTLH